MKKPAAAIAAVPAPVRVARALRETVETEGHPVVRWLYDAYAAANRDHFGAGLPDCTILLSPPSSPRALGDHCKADEHGLRYRVRIAPSVVRKGERLLADVLLHELVHVACSAAGEDEPGYKGHGPKFAVRCNAIGQALGLPPVGVKGRDGLPDCAQWPCNVRPPGYYPTAAKKKAAPKAKHGGAAGEAPGDAAELSPAELVRVAVRWITTKGNRDQLEALELAIALRRHELDEADEREATKKTLVGVLGKAKA